jgi:hypothetical protein
LDGYLLQVRDAETQERAIAHQAKLDALTVVPTRVRIVGCGVLKNLWLNDINGLQGLGVGASPESPCRVRRMITAPVSVGPRPA